MTKSKLTLSINKYTVIDVKGTGVNVSELVENYLISFLRSRSYKDTKLPHRPKLSSDRSKCLYKKDLTAYVRFRGVESVSKSWLYQIQWLLTNYLDYCNWEISNEKTVRYLGVIQKKYSVSFYRKQVLQIRAFLRYQDITWLDRLKVVSEPYYSPKIITREQIEGAMGHFKGNLQCSSLILLGASSGLRASELYRLTPRDIDIEQRTVHVLQSKTGRPRVSFFGETCQRALESFLKQNKFRYLWGESHMLRAFRGVLLVKDLRKYFTQEWLRRDGNVVALEQLLGHSHKKNVLMSHYAAFSEGELREIYDKVFG
jgi:integrase